MKFFGGIHERAHKYFLMTVKMFQLKSTKESDFEYHSEEANDSTWRFKFLINRNFISRVYKLSVSYEISESSDNIFPETISWNFLKKEWQPKGQSTSYCQLLNQHKQLKKIVQAVDYESIEIGQVGGKYQITMVPIPGSYVFILLPPLQYFVKMKNEEMIKIKELAYKVQETIIDYQKKTAG
ncbi:hypothetical protein [Metabacillus litoralis]|uniref:hypothetical protein n=1 Tax=Metabacillus litoralis TaxID=152268 RepID=UPI000EF6087A|nr:hypothetical protein [Metabacillus litoralis]